MNSHGSLIRRTVNSKILKKNALSRILSLILFVSLKKWDNYQYSNFLILISQVRQKPNGLLFITSCAFTSIKVLHNTTFIGYIEPVLVILHERELTWAGRVSWKQHTCMISALSISTTLKQHPLIWSAVVSSIQN